MLSRMTRRMRRDAGIRHASIITGLRMEPRLARALSAAAEGASVAAYARDLLTLALRGTTTADTEDGPMVILAAGFRAPKSLSDAIHAFRNAHAPQLTIAGTIRHLLRMQLGVSARESLASEAFFQDIAVQRRATMEQRRT